MSEARALLKVMVDGHGSEPDYDEVRRIVRDVTARGSTPEEMVRQCAVFIGEFGELAAGALAAVADEGNVDLDGLLPDILLSHAREYG